MRWEGGREGGNIEDRRGLGGPVGVGGMWVGGVVLALIGYFVFGIDPSTTSSALSGGGQYEQQAGTRGAPSDAGGRFVDVVSTNVDDVWAAIFKREGQTYQPPAAVVLLMQRWFVAGLTEGEK